MSYRLLVLLVAVACTDDVVDTDLVVGDTDIEPVTCAFTGDFGGAVDLSLVYGQSHGCSGSGYDDRVSMSFGVSDPDYVVYVSIASGAVAGETATGLPAAVELADLSVGYDGWRTPEDGCTVDITEMRPDDFFGWIVVGNGVCAEVATPTDDQLTGEVTVGPFSFTSVASYPD